MSQVVTGADANCSTEDIFSDLHRVLHSLLEHCGGLQHCVLRCSYLHSPRQPSGSSEDQSSNDVLADCIASGSLVVCSDPHAVPQLLVGPELDEARHIFEHSCVHDKPPDKSDFLQKPAHVAEEEMGSPMEALEAFNEEMLASENAPVSNFIDHSTTAADEASKLEGAAKHAAEGSDNSVETQGCPGGNQGYQVEVTRDSVVGTVGSHVESTTYKPEVIQGGDSERVDSHE